ncbi:serine hydrolase [Kaistia geumhonensis]|uniref:CubicO group peptidase (Beta-lactamase class C family) n=1 Tax=Kaistia geumhonensis TaxID=410839 RepID=A0ABU0M3R3_9HYPH|nr:serine hydrolase domain-containing protein [Kaistia geumhonensis]MCX5479199.1 serine hydrolase [Kaistia geumhonensis]MDQ0515581.1 CubicO group peptidase (beta-lactamase class C family) [Kaistia geumhonensis]
MTEPFERFAPEALAARLDPVVDAAIAEGRIVGAVLLVAHDGVPVFTRAAGHADREAGVPTQTDTVFRLASVTKPMVAATALALVEDGILSLDDPVTRFLPAFRPALADGSVPVITVRHLLTHTAGLRYGYDASAGICEGLAGPRLAMAENLARIAAQPLAFAPGSAFLYSVAIDVLGGLLEQAAGASLPELVARKVTGPLGLSDTEFHPSNPDRLATAYADGAPRAVPMSDPCTVMGTEGGVTFSPGRAFDREAFPSGGAGMVGTAPDFLRFLEAVRRGGAPILSPESVDLLGSNAIGSLYTGVEGRGFSLGWSIHHTPAASGAPYGPGSWQWGGVYGHSWFVDPANRLSVVSFTNTALAGVGGAYPDAVRDAVYG